MAALDSLFQAGSGYGGRLGSDKWAANSTALFLKKFAGEVMTVFDQKNIMKPLHTIRTITKGKSAQFPVIGTAAADYYSPGEDILSVDATGLGVSGGLNAFKQTEVMIHIDKVLMSSTFIASVDELVNHYDVRSPYTHQLGEALANKFDRNVLQVAIKTGAQGAAAGYEESVGASTGGAASLGLLPLAEWIPGQTPKGSVVYSKKATTDADAEMNANSSYATDSTVNALRHTPSADALRKALFESARLLDEKDVPSSDRYAIVTPKMYYELVNNTSGTDILSSSIHKDVGGEGSIAAGTIVRVAGITILTSNHLPSDDVTTDPNQWAGASDVLNNYKLNYSHVAGLVFQKGGFGTLKLMDLTMESEYLIARQGNLFVAKYSMGHGPLRPESVVVWSDGTQPDSRADNNPAS